jgi:uncharacterized RDD family membrane protein YckC
VRARYQPVEVQGQASVVSASLGVGKVTRNRSIEAADLLDVLGLEATQTAPAGTNQQCVEFAPRWGAPLDEGGLRHAVLGTPAMDRTLEVRTPESIAFSYELAGVGSRFLALAVDFTIQITLLLLLFWGLTLVAGHAGPHPISLRGADRVVYNLTVALIIAIVFLIFFGYFIVLETFWNGQTPGKRLLGIRVVRDGGYPLDFMAALIRNLIRVGEMAVGFYALSAVVAVFSPLNKRIGDLAAGTIVIRESRMESPEKMLREVAEPVYAATAYVSGEERALIRRFLERRTDLVTQRRAAIAHQLAERVRPRLPTDMQRMEDEDLLERL